MKRQLYNNIISTFIAQMVGVVASICMTGLIPKCTTVLNFSYWQLFVFYSSFVGILHLGFIDGIYLKYGGEELDNLPRELVRSCFAYFVLWQFLLAGMAVALALLFFNGPELIVLLFTSLYIPIKNVYSFFNFMLLATNRIVHNSKCDIIRKGVLTVILLVVFFANETTLNYSWIIVIFLISELVPFGFIVKPFKVIFSEFSLLNAGTCWDEIKSLTINGSFLTISNIVSTLILGIGRFFIKSNWSIETFGIVSLSLSLTFFLIAIITQASQTLFPYIRNADINKQKRIYDSLSDTLSLMFSLVLVLYFPLATLVKYWLPNYTASVDYLSILCLICLFEGKMGLLCTTYMKCMNKQRTLMLINLVTLGISALSTGISAYVFDSLDAVLYCMVISLAIRYFITDQFVRKLMEMRLFNNALLMDMTLALLFLVIHENFGSVKAFILMFAIVGCTALLRRKVIVSTYQIFKITK